MTNDQARLLLQAYRPGEQDAENPLYSEALEQVRRDPELARWFEAEQNLDAAIGEKFREASVPAHLQPDIMALEIMVQPRRQWRRELWMAAAAVVLALAVAAFWLPHRQQPRFATYRGSMTEFLSTRFDHLDFKARDVAQLKQFLAQHGAPSDFILPAGLGELPGHGCRVLEWDGHTVSLICFHLADGKEIHLFVIEGAKFAGVPPSGSAQFASDHRWTTAGWQRGNTTYLLAGNGDQAFLQKYL